MDLKQCLSFAISLIVQHKRHRNTRAVGPFGVKPFLAVTLKITGDLVLWLNVDHFRSAEIVLD